jgi:hypothetical protein
MSDQIESTATSAAQLNLTDLVAILQILQLATDRGTFKEEELPTIGILYKRIFTFVEASGASMQSVAPSDTSTEGNQS